VQGKAHSPDWQSIETVLLDMDGTLLDLGFDNRFWEDFLPRRYAESRGVTLEEAHRLMRPLFEGTKGTLDWYCIDYWSRALSLDIAALKRSVRQQIAWLPESRRFLATVRASGRRTVLVTNAHPEILSIKDAQLGIRRHFDAVYTCFTFGVPKESAEVWPRLAEEEGFDTRRTLFADDSPAVLRAARAHGIQWIYAVGNVADFPSVNSVHELAAGLAPLAIPAQTAGP
jgi:putative hydrolase of the HAD superfamily